MIIGSPIYYSNLTGQCLSFINRLLFPVMHYQLDPTTNRPEKVLEKEKKCAIITTMNANEQFYNMKYEPIITSITSAIESILGSCESMAVYDTLQFNDYSKYYAGMFDENHKRKRHDQQFSIDLEKAYNLGRQIAKK